jgi:flagellar M-ring protein FliF
MNKIKEFFKSLGDKWKNLSKATKISIILISIGLITSLITFSVYSTKVTYAPLFYNLQPQDAAKIREKLISDKVSYKISDGGATILVPKEKVDDLRLSVYSDGTVLSSGKGYELFDQSNFGLTETESKVMYQRALEGELARTIQGFDEVEQARVHLVLPEESVFTKDTEKATASVTLKLKGTSTLTPEQVKAIISFVSGSVKNLPKENVEIVDSNLNLLSENLFDSTTSSGTLSASKQQDMEKQFEGNIQGDVKKALEAVFGKDKVSVTVNADLDFDSKQISTIKYDNFKIERSQKIIKESATDSTGSSSSGTSPVDNNMQNTVGTGSANSSQSTHDESTVNYEIPQTQETVVKAPGEIKRMTVSVIIDGDLNADEKSSIKDIVAAATGYSETRGDVINIAAYRFNTDVKDKAQKDLEAMNADKAQSENIKRIAAIAIAGVALFIALVLLLRLFKKKRKKKVAVNTGIADIENKPLIDVLVNDSLIQKPRPEYQPVLSEEEELDMSLEKELQGYANKKPDQVIEVIKSWLSDDER